jgi:hypothetical protein
MQPSPYNWASWTNAILGRFGGGSVRLDIQHSSYTFSNQTKCYDRKGDSDYWSCKHGFGWGRRRAHLTLKEVLFIGVAPAFHLFSDIASKEECWKSQFWETCIESPWSLSKHDSNIREEASLPFSSLTSFWTVAICNHPNTCRCFGGHTGSSVDVATSKSGEVPSVWFNRDVLRVASSTRLIARLLIVSVS